MNIKLVIEKIIHIPRVFKNSGNKSFHSLLKDTGYFEIADQIHEEEINFILTENPGFIADWKLLSEDKRTSSGWYFTELDNGKYIVGYFDRIKKIIQVLSFRILETLVLFLLARNRTHQVTLIFCSNSWLYARRIAG